MARSVNTIYNDLIIKVKEGLGISEATVISAVSLEGILCYAFAVATNVVEQIFDAFKAEVTEAVSRLKPHTLKWYASIAELFQYGYELDSDTLEYDNTGLTDEDIAAAKIIEYVAVVELENVLRIKVAKQGALDLEVLTSPEQTAFEAYMNRKKDAGVKLQIESNEPDDLKLTADIYVDPLLFNADGTLIEGGDPVRDAIKTYLKNLPFNGVFALALLVDEIQKVPGVVLPHILLAESRYGALPLIP